MLSFRASLAFVLAAAVAASPALASHVHRGPTSGHRHSATSRKSTATSAKAVKATVHRIHGQQAIDAERVTEIQTALVREHYLDQDPNGRWDSVTQAAMQKFQADQGWQTKLMPDSRALKKLGLGPDYSTAINANTGHFADPPPVSTIPATVVAGFTAGSGVSNQ